MEAFLAILARTLNRGIAVLGATLPGLVLAALKLDLLLLFSWYAWEFCVEVPGGFDCPHLLIAGPALLLLIFGAWCFIAVYPPNIEEDRLRRSGGAACGRFCS
jgi:hypothetical protein